MNELEIVNNALNNLENTTRIKGRWKPGRKELDGQIDFLLKDGNISLYVEVKNNLRAIHLRALYKMAKRYAPLIVVTNHLFPKLKEELRNHQIAYLEENGNIWLQYKKTLLWIEGNKALPAEKEKTNRAFTKTGLKVLFLLLLEERFINATYREIANKAGIALGYVKYVLNGLKEKGFILKLNKDENKIINKKELFDTWIIRYEENLKPELEIGRFRFLKQEDFLDWKKMTLAPGKTYWGEEPAGNLLTNYLRPGTLTLYTLENRAELMKNYRLVPDPAGNVKVYKKFWDNDKVNDNFVPPLLAYADLINTGDPRCMETAEKIYNEFFKDKF